MKYKLHMAYANREDLAAEAIETVRDIGNIHVWPNGGAHDPGLINVTVHELPPMAPVSIINLLIHESWDDDVMFWMHNDAFARPGAAKRLLDFVTECHESGHKWGAVFTNYDVLSVFNMNAIRDVGYWDPMFFQYTADVEYYSRMRRAGWTIDESHFGANDVEHRTGSITIHTDPQFNLRTQWRQRTNFDKDYHFLKWGSFPGADMRYAKPFDGKTEKHQ